MLSLLLQLCVAMTILLATMSPTGSSSSLLSLSFLNNTALLHDLCAEFPDSILGVVLAPVPSILGITDALDLAAFEDQEDSAFDILVVPMAAPVVELLPPAAPPAAAAPASLDDATFLERILVGVIVDAVTLLRTGRGLLATFWERSQPSLAEGLGRVVAWSVSVQSAADSLRSRACHFAQSLLSRACRFVQPAANTIRSRVWRFVQSILSRACRFVQPVANTIRSRVSRYFQYRYRLFREVLHRFVSDQVIPLCYSIVFFAPWGFPWLYLLFGPGLFVISFTNVWLLLLGKRRVLKWIRKGRSLRRAIVQFLVCRAVDVFFFLLSIFFPIPL